MTIDQAKNIKIADYLQAVGYTPTKRNGNTLMYLSSLRDERTASFKVDSERNLWYDFGLSVGGNIIDLAMQLNNTCSVSEALAAIGSSQLVPTYRVTPLPTHSESTTKPENMTLQPIQTPTLPQLLTERNISISVAQRWCKELHYTRDGKRYFAIVFANDKGGYEMRNRYYKGCVAPRPSRQIYQIVQPATYSRALWIFSNHSVIADIKNTIVNVDNISTISEIGKSINMLINKYLQEI